MAEFAYDAINAQGLELRGWSARRTSNAREQLQARGLLPQQLRERAASGEDSFGSMFKKVKPKSLQIFARQLATMIEAGVSVVAALVTLEEQTDDKYLKEVVSEVVHVSRGRSSRAHRAAPKVFNRLFVRDGRGGRVVGNARHSPRPRRDADREGDEARAAREERDDLPGGRIAFASLVLIFMLLFIVPVFVEGVRRAERTLPMPTRIIMTTSETGFAVLVHHLPDDRADHLPAPRLKRTPAGVRRWDRFKLGVPMKIGDVVQKVALARFSRRSRCSSGRRRHHHGARDHRGTSATGSRGAAEDAARVHEGVPISGPLAEDPIFPPMVSQMVDRRGNR